jgi:hypothetical protein
VLAIMRKYEGIPELLEQFMQEQGAEERWVTVQEFRDRFALTRYQCTTISGFLRRLEFGPFGGFSYIVTRIEHTGGAYPSSPTKSRYLVKRKGTEHSGVPAMIPHNALPGRRKAGSGGSG